MGSDHLVIGPSDHLVTAEPPITRSPDALASADLPEAFVLVVESQQPITRVVTPAAVGAGNEAADVHSPAVVILGNGKAGAATARDQKHAKIPLGSRIVLRRPSLHTESRNVRVGTGVSPVLGCVGTAALGCPSRAQLGSCRSPDNNQPSTAASEPFFRLFDCRIFFLNRSDFGVTSTNSSSAINSMACSRLRLR